jgi:hypothetical protein
MCQFLHIFVMSWLFRRIFHAVFAEITEMS